MGAQDRVRDGEAGWWRRCVIGEDESWDGGGRGREGVEVREWEFGVRLSLGEYLGRVNRV